jgi:acyl carrier protein
MTDGCAGTVALKLSQFRYSRASCCLGRHSGVTIFQFELTYDVRCSNDLLPIVFHRLGPTLLSVKPAGRRLLEPISRRVAADQDMNDPENIVAAIYRAVDWINGELLPDRQLIKASETRLLGSQSVLDSMRLVSLIVTIEREVEDTFGVALTLADERALSMKASPFRSIQSLADYIGLLIRDARNG